MTVTELMARLKNLPGDALVVVEDLRGLWWQLEPSLVRVTDGCVVIGDRDRYEIEYTEPAKYGL